MTRRDLEELRRRPIGELQALQKAIEGVIDQKRQSPTEWDIALEHSDPSLVAEVLESRRSRPGRSTVLQKIYCSVQRCKRCPHGPYLYAVRENKRRRTRVVRCVGAPALSQDVLSRIEKHVRPPLAVFKIVLPGDRNGQDDKREG